MKKLIPAVVDVDHYLNTLKRSGLLPSYADLPVNISITEEEITISYTTEDTHLELAGIPRPT